MNQNIEKSPFPEGVTVQYVSGHIEVLHKYQGQTVKLANLYYYGSQGKVQTADNRIFATLERAVRKIYGEYRDALMQQYTNAHME